MGCGFSSPAVSPQAIYYIDPAGAAAGDAFGLPGDFNDGFFTCGGPVMTPYLYQTVGGVESTYTCKPFHAGVDTSLLCPTVTRSKLTGEIAISFATTLAGDIPVTTGGSLYFTVQNAAPAFVSQDVTYTVKEMATVTAGLAYVTSTVLQDAGADWDTTTITSYGRTRNVDVPVTSTSTYVLMKTTTVKTCPEARRVRARDFSPQAENSEELVKRDSGYAGFDGVFDFDGSATSFTGTVYETNYYGTVTIAGATETTIATVNTNGLTMTKTDTTRVHDATTTYITVSKTATTRSTSTVTRYPTTCGF